MTTMVEDTRAITGGVDTHADMHVAAALDSIGGLLGVREFPATVAGYAELLGWLRSLGNLALAGVEGTGSYGAGLARYLERRALRARAGVCGKCARKFGGGELSGAGSRK
jgi:transposase